MYSERTQVLLSPAQRRRLERMAVEQRRSVGAVIRDAVEAYVGTSTRSREEAANSLLGIGAPTADWHQMKAEILRGALGEGRS
jgi:predicted transcriptional regulator